MALGGGASVAAAYEAQLSIEYSAKAVIGFFKPQPGFAIQQHKERFKEVESEERLNTLATIADGAVPHHALTSYRDVVRMLTPREVYKPEEVEELVKKARGAQNSRGSYRKPQESILQAVARVKGL